MRKKNYRLECESVDPKICEAITRVRILPEDCSTPAKRCSNTNGFKIYTCPCSDLAVVTVRRNISKVFSQLWLLIHGM